MATELQFKFEGVEIRAPSKPLNYKVDELGIEVLNYEDFPEISPKIGRQVFKDLGGIHTPDEILANIKACYKTNVLNDVTSQNVGRKCIREIETGLGVYTNDKGFSDFVCPSCKFADKCHAESVKVPEKKGLMNEFLDRNKQENLVDSGEEVKIKFERTPSWLHWSVSSDKAGCYYHSSGIGYEGNTPEAKTENLIKELREELQEKGYKNIVVETTISPYEYGMVSLWKEGDSWYWFGDIAHSGVESVLLNVKHMLKEAIRLGVKDAHKNYQAEEKEVTYGRYGKPKENEHLVYHENLYLIDGDEYMILIAEAPDFVNYCDEVKKVMGKGIKQENRILTEKGICVDEQEEIIAQDEISENDEESDDDESD